MSTTRHNDGSIFDTVLDPDEGPKHFQSNSPALRPWRPNFNRSPSPIREDLAVATDGTKRRFRVRKPSPKQDLWYSIGAQQEGCDSCNLRSVDCPGGVPCGPCLASGLECLGVSYPLPREDGTEFKDDGSIPGDRALSDDDDFPDLEGDSRAERRPVDLKELAAEALRGAAHFNPSNTATSANFQVLTCFTCAKKETFSVHEHCILRLPCGHHVCNSCLRQAFNLSLKDHEHMPPRKCCTEEPLTIQDVDWLFDREFKEAWNKRYVDHQQSLWRKNHNNRAIEIVDHHSRDEVPLPIKIRDGDDGKEASTYQTPFESQGEPSNRPGSFDWRATQKDQTGYQEPPALSPLPSFLDKSSRNKAACTSDPDEESETANITTTPLPTIVDGLFNLPYVCQFSDCTAAFQTQYLLSCHANIHSSARPYYCHVPGCPRSEGGKGFKRKDEMIRHGLVHDSPGYVCPFCPDREHKYPRPDNLQRHVRVHHIDKDKDDPMLRDVLSQRPKVPGGRNKKRRHLPTEGDAALVRLLSTGNDPNQKPAPSRGDAVLVDFVDSIHETSAEPTGVDYLGLTQVPLRRLFCTKCNYYPKGFIGESELYKHIDSIHSASFVKRWICTGLWDVRQTNSSQWLAFEECKACVTESKYGTSWEAWEHLRESHRITESGLAAMSVGWVREVRCRLRDLIKDYRQNNFAPSMTLNLDIPGVTSHEEAELLLTDSGYESAPPLIDEGRMQNIGNITETSQQADNDDTGTIISVATAIVPSAAQQAIAEVCDAIYSQIQRSVDVKNCNAFLQTLPGLLRAFAVKLALSDASNLNRRIMHFIYTHHQEIVAHMRHLCHGKAEEEKIPSKPKEGMSLQEKMLMWQSESRANSPEIDATDHFEGVEDIDDSLSHIELSAYSNIIFKSQSYDWLVKTLIKESLFHWDNSQPNIMVHDIREEIMKALPTGRISRKESPCTYKTTFSIQWLPIKQRLEREQTSNGLTAIESVFSTIVLTSSSIDHIQAMTTEEYINQTWTSGGKELLQVIGDVFEDSQTNGSDVTVYGPYKNDIVKATLRGLNVDIVVTGSPRAVSERGEMIAWLVAALQDPGARNLVQYFPSLGKQGAKQCIGQQPEDSGQSWKVEINPVIAGDAPNLSPLRKMGWLGEKDGWLGGIIQPVIVRGFPTTRRPFPGIEVSTNVLFSPLSAIKFDASRHQVSLPGTDTLLELVKEIDGVCLWHVLFTPSSRCECATHPRTRLDLVGDIRKYRHVIGDCLWTCNSSQRLSSHPADFVSDKATGSHIMDLPRTESSITNSKDTPIDSDMMSIPDSPENDCPSPLATPHVLSPVIRAVAFRLVDSYREARLTTSGSNSLSYSSFTIDEDSGNISTDPTENESPSNDGRPTSSGAVNHAQGSDQNPPSPSRKRMRDDEGDDNEDPNNGRNPMPPPKRPKRGSEIPSGKSLACPFWKFDPEQHKDCLKTKQRYFQVNRVKQHLTRRHTKVYCERCKTIFKDEPGHQHHLEHAGPACVFKPWNPHHGVTRRQQAKLHKKSSSSLTDSEQWFAMWAILFPNRPQPRSPYIDQYLSDDLRHFREYAQDRGSQFLSEDLLSRGLSLPPELTSDEAISSHLARIISSGMDRMIEDWISSGHNGDRGPRRGQDDEPRSEPSEHETAAGSLADSGLGLSSSQPGLQLESIFHINDTNDPITLPVPNIVVPTDDQVPMECNEQQPNFVGYSLTLDFDFEGSNDFSADMQDHSESNCWDETFGGGYDFHDQT